MAADSFVQFRVTAEIKALLRARAHRHQITESALLRQLVEFMPRDDGSDQLPKRPEIASVEMRG
jgi:hypothetical protein